MTAIKSPSSTRDTRPGDHAPAASPRSRIQRLARRSPIPFGIAIVVAIVMILPFITLIISALTPADQMGIDRWLPQLPALVQFRGRSQVHPVLVDD